MNRIISYRVWDVLLERMMAGDLLNTTKKSITTAPEYLMKIMYFTGFIDKNVVDIYESDILRIRRAGINGQEIEENAVVVWTDGSWALDYINKDDEHHYFHEVFMDMKNSNHAQINAEVIGNIYENKELLK